MYVFVCTQQTNIHTGNYKDAYNIEYTAIYTYVCTYICTHTYIHTYIHYTRPSSLLKVPGGQPVQVAEEVAPKVALKVPDGHL